MKFEVSHPEIAYTQADIKGAELVCVLLSVTVNRHFLELPALPACTQASAAYSQA